jgi:PAS domain S-box-containing protein
MGETLGLIQIRDLRPGILTAERIALLEKLASYTAIAIAKQRSDEALRESGEFSRQVIDSLNEGVVVMDRELRIKLWNPYMEQLSGLPAERVLGGNPLRLFPSLTSAGILEHMEQALRGRMTEPAEFFVSSPSNGRSHWILTTHAPLRNTLGEVIGVIATVCDITDRRFVQETLKRANDYNRSLIEAGLDALVTIGPDGRITDVNAATEEVTGYPRETLIGTDFSDYFTDTEAARSGYRKVFRESAVRDYPLEIRHRKGYTTPVLYNATVYRNEEGSVIGVFAAARDITERKKAEETLRTYTRRLMEKEEELRRMLAAELHDEIGRDMTALGINCTIISHQLPSELEKQLGTRIQDSARLIEGVTRTVRNIMNRLRPPMLDDYGLAAALRWHADLFSKRTGIPVRVLVDESCRRLSTEKETALFRIAQEALTNIAKHAAAGKVTVLLRCGYGVTHLSIADNGVGFAREPAAMRGTEAGWGVSIMRERAELFGGSVRVDSAPGEGTTVTVEIGEDV